MVSTEVNSLNYGMTGYLQYAETRKWMSSFRTLNSPRKVLKSFEGRAREDVGYVKLFNTMVEESSHSCNWPCD